MTNKLNPYIVLVAGFFIIYLTGCQTLKQVITPESCSLACHPGRVDKVETIQGVCTCAEVKENKL